MLLLGYAAVVAFLALLAHRPRVGRAARRWGDRTDKRVLPETSGRAKRSGTVWRPVLLLATVAFAAIGLWQQDQADRRTAHAEAANAMVESHQGDSAIVLRFADDSTARVPVVSPANYPVGKEIWVKVDDRGLPRPVAEPEDDSGWFIGAGLAGIAGLGLQLRFSRRIWAWRRLRRAPQPVCAVWYEPLWHAIYPGDVGELDQALAVVANPLMVPGGLDSSEGGVRSAVLYGIPVMGGYCAVVPDGGGSVVFGQLARAPHEARWPHAAGAVAAIA